jgi:hypothetical protein
MELREALEAAATEQEKVNEVQSAPVQEAPVEAAPVDAPSDAPEEPAGTEVSDPVPPDAPAAEKQDGQKQPSDPAPVLPQGQHRVDRAPASWKKEAKGEWAAVPLHIRQEVHRREMEISRALNEAAQSRQQAEQFQQVVTPYMARIQSFGVTPQQAVAQLLQADHVLATGTKAQRAQLMAKLVKDYDVDIAELDSALVGSVPSNPETPDIQALVQQQLQQALAPLYQQQQQAQIQQQQQVEQTVEQMALDPKYPLFDEVRQDMADIIELNAKRGIYISLTEAYNKAILINPQASQQMQQQSAAQQATQQHLQAQKAKAASLSVTGAPASGGSGQFAGDGSMRGAIEAAFSNIRV